MGSLRDTVREYLGLSGPGAGYSLAQNVPGHGSARMSQLYGYAPPPQQQPPPPLSAQQYAPPPYAPIGAQQTYPPPPEIQPVERRGSVPPSPIPAAGDIPSSVHLSQCAAPPPQQTPGMQRPAYAGKHGGEKVPHGRGRGRGRERNRANSRAPTLGRGLAASAPGFTPTLPLHADTAGLAAAVAPQVDAEAFSDSSSGGDDGDQQRHHHHHHRHYHRQYAQQQQQVAAASQPVPVPQPQQQQVVVQPQIQQPVQQQPQGPIVIAVSAPQPQPQPQVALYVKPKDVTKRRKESQQPIEHKAYFILGVTLLEVAIYVFELIKTSAVTKITFGSNPWQWGGVDANVVIDVGGKYAPYILSRGEWWRFFTPVFMHVSLVHIIMNLLMQLKIGIALERSYGAFRIGALYIICGVGGNLVSCIFLYTQIQAGASGALFGFMGILLVDLIQNWKIVCNPVRNLVFLIIAIVVSIAFGMMPGVDNFAHLGGMIFGIIAGFVFLPSLAPAKGKGVRWGRVCTILVFFPILAALFVALFVVFYTVVGAGHYSTEWCPWCSQINCASAILGDAWCKSA